MRITFYLLFLTLGGCEHKRSVGTGPAPPKAVAEAVPTVAVAAKKIDILFMMDNSPSTTPKQEELKKQFPLFVQKLKALATDGHPVSYHIGVVTSDLGAGPFILGGGACTPGGDGGRLQALPAMGGPANCKHVGNDTVTNKTANYIDYDQVNNKDNLPTGQTLATTFSCMASVGFAGCGFEHVLESVYVALKTPPTENAGFLRDDALLAVVFVTDEDDCSAPPDTDLFDPSNLSYGAPNSSFRCTQFGLEAGDPPVTPLDVTQPVGSSVLIFSHVAPAPNPTGSSIGHLWDVNRYINFFTQPKTTGGVKTDPSQVYLVSIAAPVVDNSIHVTFNAPTTKCPNTGQIGSCPFLGDSCISSADSAFFGDPAVRLSAVVNSLANKSHSIEHSMCDLPYSTALDSLVAALADGLNPKNSCLPAAISYVDGAASCSVSDVKANGDGTTTTTVLPECRGGNPSALPCWKLENSVDCIVRHNPVTGADETLRLLIRRDVTCDPMKSFPPDGTVTQASCNVLSTP